MLIAETIKGTVINVVGLTRTALETLQRTETFRCPQCKAPVQLKIGTVITPHFAHKVASSCRELFTEGESEEHLRGKTQLYEWLKTRVNHVWLEPTIKNFSQRPDILVLHNNHYYALEFQCSAIKTALLEKRNAGYAKANITPIWIFNTPKFAYYQGVVQQRLRKMYQYTLPHTIFYSPTTKKFTYATFLYRLYHNQFLMRLAQVSLDRQVFPLYQPKPLRKTQAEAYSRSYTSGYKRFLHNCIRYPRGNSAKRLRRCTNGLYLSFSELNRSFPVFLPHTLGADVVWQTELALYCKEQKIWIEEVEPEHFLTTFSYIVSDDNCKAIRYYCENIKGISAYTLTELFAISHLQWENKTDN
ncbi:MAG TPA: hypothetical protein K8V30_04460 [Metalysinibacillus jejuensis]|uniref:Competence protein CoiA n=1 Tax=Metalysinibacillus jejuensis TaxID=914327 RepID=A0A921T4F1_9BACL|nr:hypothetical protein [Metalysinibacillus jejuensis]